MGGFSRTANCSADVVRPLVALEGSHSEAPANGAAAGNLAPPLACDLSPSGHSAHGEMNHAASRPLRDCFVSSESGNSERRVHRSLNLRPGLVSARHVRARPPAPISA